MMYRDWITYAAGAFFVIVYITDVMVMNLSVSLYNQLYVVPFGETLAIVFNLLSGGLILGEFYNYNEMECALVFVGCILTVFGLVTKSSFGEKDVDMSGDDQDDPPLQAIEESKEGDPFMGTKKKEWYDAVNSILDHR